MRRAVASLVSGDDAVRASVARKRAFELLGRDSESLSERNFTRILRDAHDADIIDLRRLGDDYEVAQAATAVPVSEQLNVAAAAHAVTATSNAGSGGRGGSGIGGSATPAPPRGLGPRGARPRRGLPGGRSSAPPADLLTVGMVDITPTAPRIHESPSRATPLEASTVVEPATNGLPAEEAADGVEIPTVAPKRTRARTKSGRVVAIADPDEKKPRRPRGRSAPNSTEG